MSGLEKVNESLNFPLEARTPSSAKHIFAGGANGQMRLATGGDVMQGRKAEEMRGCMRSSMCEKTVSGNANGARCPIKGQIHFVPFGRMLCRLPLSVNIAATLVGTMFAKVLHFSGELKGRWVEYADLLKNEVDMTDLQKYLAEGDVVAFTVRIPRNLLDAAKQAASMKGMAFSAYVRMSLIDELKKGV